MSLINIGNYNEVDLTEKDEREFMSHVSLIYHAYIIIIIGTLFTKK